VRTKPISKILHKIEVPIKGNEPFLSFGRTTLIVNLHDSSGRPHNFLESFGNASLTGLRNGDVLQFQMVVVRQFEMTWYESLVHTVKGWFK